MNMEVFRTSLSISVYFKQKISVFFLNKRVLHLDPFDFKMVRVGRSTKPYSTMDLSRNSRSNSIGKHVMTVIEASKAEDVNITRPLMADYPK